MRKILLSPHMPQQAIGNLAELRYVRVRLHPDYDQKLLYGVVVPKYAVVVVFIQVQFVYNIGCPVCIS